MNKNNRTRFSGFFVALAVLSFSTLQLGVVAAAATSNSQLSFTEVSTGKSVSMEIQQPTEQNCTELPSASTGLTLCSFNFQYRIISGAVSVLNLVVLDDNNSEVGYLGSSIVLPGANWSSSRAYASISGSQNVRLAISSSDSSFKQGPNPLPTVKLVPRNAPKAFTLKPKFPRSVTQYSSGSVLFGESEIMQYAVPTKMSSTGACVNVPFVASPLDWDSGQPEDQAGAKYHDIKVQIWNKAGKQIAKGGIVGGVNLWSPVSKSTTFSVKACGVSMKRGSKTTFDVVIDAGARLVGGCCSTRSNFKLQVTKK